MSVEKKLVPFFKIYSPSDLSKEWFIYFSESGKRRKIKGGINRFHTIEERQMAAAALVKKLEVEYVPPSPIADKMLEWVELHKGRWKPKTCQTVRSRVEVFLVWLKGRNLTPELMRNYFAEFASSHHARTHNEHLGTFRRIFKWLEKPEMVEGIEMMKAVSTPAKYFQQYQVERIKKELCEHDPSLWLACQFIYYCFIRPGELRLLKVGDIHFDDWKICIRASISKNKKEQYITVPIAFRRDLEPLKRRSPAEYVFYHLDCTKPLGINTLLNRFRKVLRRLGFGLEYKLYSWKHTGAVGCARSGVNLEQIRIQLRHHSLDEVKGYLRQMGVEDLDDLDEKFPAI